MPARASSTRERIMQAAFELFLAQGIHGTAVTDIERAVGLTAGRGSFYKHFRSKDDLLAAVIEREVARCMQEAVAARAEITLPDDPRAAMATAARQNLVDHRRFADLFRLMISEGDRVPQLREIFSRALNSTDSLGDWIDDATRYVVIAALMGFHTFELTGVDAFSGVTADQFIEALVALVPDVRPPGTPRSSRSRRNPPTRQTRSK